MNKPVAGDKVLFVHIAEPMTGHDLIESLTELAGSGQILYTAIPVSDGQVLVFHSVEAKVVEQASSEVIFDSGEIIQ